MLIAIIAASIIIGSFNIGKIVSDELSEKTDFPIDGTKR